MRALVTGGAGFIGSHLAARLVADGHDVRVLDNFATGRRSNIDAIGPEVELIEGDIQSYERAHKAVRGCDVVFHQAALPSVPRSIQDPLTSNATNVIGTLNILLAARDEGIRRVICASSSSVYGANPTLPKQEDMAALPISPYATAKLAGEGYCRSFGIAYGLETVALRYFNVYGTRQDPTSQYAAVIPNFITALLENRPVTIYGDGEQSRDFTHVDNVVQANLLAMDAPDVTARSSTSRAAARSRSTNSSPSCRSSSASTSTSIYEPARAGDVQHSLASLTARAPGIWLRAGGRTARGSEADDRCLPGGAPGGTAVRGLVGCMSGDRPRRVRVIRVIARLNVGGPAHHVSILAGRLDPARYETFLLAGRLGPGEGSFENLPQHHGAEVRYIDGLGPELAPIDDARALYSLVRAMRRFRPDIVHTHTAKAGTLGRLAARIALGPRPIVVHTYHGHVLSGYFGPAKTQAFRAIERALGFVTDQLIGVSSATVDELVAMRIAPRSRFMVLPIGLNLDGFLAAEPQDGAAFRREARAGPHDVLALFVGRLAPIKRLDVLLEAVAVARARARHYGWRSSAMASCESSWKHKPTCSASASWRPSRGVRSDSSPGSLPERMSLSSRRTTRARRRAHRGGRAPSASRQHGVGGVSDIVADDTGVARSTR